MTLQENNGIADHRPAEPSGPAGLHRRHGGSERHRHRSRTTPSTRPVAGRRLPASRTGSPGSATDCWPPPTRVTWPAAPAAGASSTRPPAPWSGMPATPWSGMAISVGLYPESRSENKGTEPENITVGRIDGRRLRLRRRRARQLRRGLRLGATRGPRGSARSAGDQRSGGAAGPPQARASRRVQRDRRARGQRAVDDRHLPARPRGTGVPGHRSGSTGGVPIGWGALSGLSADPRRADRLWSVSDSYYTPTKLYSDRDRAGAASARARGPPR